MSTGFLGAIGKFATGAAQVAMPMVIGILRPVVALPVVVLSSEFSNLRVMQFRSVTVAELRSLTFPELLAE